MESNCTSWTTAWTVQSTHTHSGATCLRPAEPRLEQSNPHTHTHTQWSYLFETSWTTAWTVQSTHTHSGATCLRPAEPRLEQSNPHTHTVVLPVWDQLNHGLNSPIHTHTQWCYLFETSWTTAWTVQSTHSRPSRLSADTDHRMLSLCRSWTSPKSHLTQHIWAHADINYCRMTNCDTRLWLVKTRSRAVWHNWVLKHTTCKPRPPECQFDITVQFWKLISHAA